MTPIDVTSRQWRNHTINIKGNEVFFTTTEWPPTKRPYTKSGKPRVRKQKP